MVDYRLSIAIVTRNRPDSLVKTLNSLRQQSIQPFEVVISDDSDNELSLGRNQELAERFACRYVSGPKRGLYANRNHAAKSCTGTHIRTMDDDHTFPENHFKVCLEKIREDPDSIWIIGEWYPNLGHEGRRPLCPGEIHPRGFSVKPKNDQNCKAISCGASIYPRNIIDQNILNIEEFKFGQAYLEYGCRLWHLGFRIRHLSETFVYHDYSSNPPSFTNQHEIMDSKVYAMMALSFVYEPTLKNKLYTLAQLTYLFLKEHRSTSHSIMGNIKRIRYLKRSLQNPSFSKR